MRDSGKALTVLIGALGALMLLVLLGAGMGYTGLLLLLVLGAAYSWMLFAFVYYRQCRQEELVEVIRAAATAEAPLSPALWAYLRDRPQGGLREFWLAVLLNFVVPGFYWLWYRRSNYDHKVDQLAQLLEEGHGLHEALRMTPRVASRATLLAVALGEETGQLARCLEALRNPDRNRLANAWLELVPRFAYPLFLLFVIGGILQFWSIYLLPKFRRIFADMSMSLPEETERVIALGDFAETYSWALVLGMQGLAAVLILLFVSPGFRWYFPVVGHLYRGYVRSQVLQALAFLLQVQQPAPRALTLLARSGSFARAAQWRLQDARHWVVQREPLADSLRRGNCVPRSMVPLLRSAERTGNLPWALAELGNLLAQRQARRVQRLGTALFPLPVVGLGVLVGAIVLGLFMPVIHLIEGLAQ